MNAEEIALPLVNGPMPKVGLAFDRMAGDYDRLFTDSQIGRAQRESVWEVLAKTFRVSDIVLELNCGTGEDALFLAGNGVSVVACDASGEMIARAQQRLQCISTQVPVIFHQLPTEQIGKLHQETPFDGAFSNFSGLNCVADLRDVSSSIASLVKQNGQMVFCFSTRFCLIEIFYYAILGQWKKALRRCKGYTEAKLDGIQFTVYYPTLRQIRRCFAPDFSLECRKGIGVAIPPSYLEPWAKRHPHIFRVLRRLEKILAPLPFFRATGDHMLLCFRKVSR